MGFYRAGFEMTGVDTDARARYPFTFVEADAMKVLTEWRWRQFLDSFDAVHASPPCQTFARVTAWRGSRDDHPDLLAPTLEILADLDVPWVVENVPEAPLRPDVMLCGSQFGLSVKRHRIFQNGNWSVPESDLLARCDHRDLLPFMHKGERAYADAMGCTWMSNRQARQAIPPSYTHYLGRLMLRSMDRQPLR